MENRRFYIYRHIRLDTNTPFYVGKGLKNRAYKKIGRNSKWTSISENGYKIEIMCTNLTNEEALAKEAFFIKLYKKFNYCEANLTSGGQGCIMADEVKLKISNTLKNHKVSDETKLKISNTLKGRKLTQQHINNMVKAQEEIKKTEEYKQKQRYSNLKNKNYKSLQQYSEYNKRKIIDSLGNIYNSIKEASEKLKVSRTKIHDSLSNKTKNPRDSISFSYYEGGGIE